jgi:arylsulfatase A-like enzyme
VPAQLAEGVSEADWRAAWAAHLGLVRLVDDSVGRVLKVLKERGQAEDTVVVFTSDHGDHLGAHCLYQKMEMYEEAIRTPLVIRAPGAHKGRNDGLVSHLDLLPTVLDLAGLSVPEDLPGKSLCGALLGGAGPQREAVFSTYDGNFVIGDARRCVIGPRFKYIWYVGGGLRQAQPALSASKGEEELYDLERDPGELVNLAAQPDFAGEKERLRALGCHRAEATGDERPDRA